ncbi:MAG: tRNA (adenosine(37)-N6)-threonylcarbamoyltransferase complex transferase subunit TsaD [Gemmatimonadetes bacterium]|nr:tRNA (adenosine(37)-N6)-threonylcarbamoyltransferase complex transferase subunit TsaD [Gemmatimonadota bacterium]MBT5452148.1 tRNA (adenosine(37)-N6)-threonylcarbamoyltransferase complex transferase subunit TsaD [Gemmatimonadota bacterium]MBT5803130.1 tRNA (adenosine(37)-N6)-threonylcarbamoyltransferase complex transferase subunit TsaD [Gemmatimonadota bacterium]MBT6622195.1 tRNA (adenosine(37)-N6)-threonylcarbamoyltransferase complex transferase subunit TsaD [Gemmatimonadota bacterium]MBT69
MLVLGIETSCDETAAAVVDESYAVHSNVIYSQQDHARYGGVVPELASRAHMRTLVPVVRKAMEDAGVDWTHIDGVAVTRGPGLVGALLVGLSLAKGLAMAQGKPLIGVHHLEGHVFSNLVEQQVEVPFLTLLVSGGHTELILVEELGSYQLLGRTRDDAAGEAFDKVAKLLELLPREGVVMGGRIIAELAERGDAKAIGFPRPLSGETDFSFSGLKTAVLNYVRKLDLQERDRQLVDIAASFQEAVVDTLVDKTILALQQTDVRAVCLAGGVAANKRLRHRLRDEIERRDIPFYCPSPVLCTDNAVMIGAVGTFYLNRGVRDDFALDVAPRLSLC